MTDFVTAVGGRADGAAPAALAPQPAPSRRRRFGWAWLGLVPFLSFLALFLIVPAFTVFSNGAKDLQGNYSFSSLRTAFSGQNLDAFTFTVWFSAAAAAVGVVIGGLLAYAAATATRPKWLRSLVSAFSGVAANMGGILLAFMFLALLGKQGILTKVLSYIGLDLYPDTWFGFDKVPGLVIVYSYFNIPLMVLITLPAIDGLKASWREANANLGGTTWTYWRRVGLPVLAPSLLGGFLLLFANSFSAYATASALTDSSRIIALRIAFYLGGDFGGEDAIGYAIASWMIVVMAVCMGAYWLLRRRAERWRT